MPSPKWALRWLLFSPVPSQTTFESFGSIATQHRVKTPLSSKIGAKVMPRFVGLPQAAECRRDVPDARVLRIDLDVDDAAGGQGRADAAQFQTFEEVSRDCGLGLPGAEPRRYEADGRHNQESPARHVIKLRDVLGTEASILSPRAPAPQTRALEGTVASSILVEENGLGRARQDVSGEAAGVSPAHALL